MNLRERLETLYDEQADLALFEDAAGGVVSRVTIPAHHHPEVPAADARASDEERGPIAAFLHRWPIGGVILAWTVWGLLWTQQSVAYLAFRGRLAERSFFDVASQDFLLVMMWAALTPVMLLASRVIPFPGRWLALRVIAHGAIASLISLVHVWATRQVLGGSPVFSADSIAAISWGMLAYAVVLTAANQVRIRNWLRERHLADARMRVGIAEAELEATYSRARPQQLLDRLEEIAQTIPADAARAERMLARLGDQLREQLDEKVPA